MSARTWFTADNTPAEVDRALLNRAARILADRQTQPLSRTDLMALRCAYRHDRCAQQIADAAADDQS